MKRSGSFYLACLLLLAMVGTGCEEQRSQIDSALFDSASEDDIENANDALPDPDDVEEGLDKPIDELGEDPLRVSVVKNQFADSQLVITLDGDVDTRLDTLVERLEWQQIQGPTAAIMAPTSASTQVALPRVTQREVLLFRLSAVAADGFADSAVARVTVLPLDNSIELVNASFLETDAQIIFEIQLTDPANQEWQLEYTTADGTALAGQDYEAVSGVTVFQTGEQRKTIPVNLLEGAVREENGYFYLQLTSLNSDRPFATQAVGVIEPDPVSESPAVSFVTFEGSCNQTQEQRGGIAGVVRFSLQWGNTSTGFGLVVNDPCENTLDQEQPAAECQTTGGMWFASESEIGLGEEVIWDNGAPEGEYQVALTHLSGPSEDFDLCIYYGEESQMYSGFLGNAETLTITQFDFAGAEPEAPGSSTSSASSSTSSSSTSSSSTSGSSSSSSTSSSSSSSSSNSASSSTSSTSSSSSSSSSSGTASGSTSSSSSSTTSSNSSSSSTSGSGGSGASTSSTSSSSGSSTSSSGGPDLWASLQQTADPFLDNGNYVVPIEVTFNNRGSGVATISQITTYSIVPPATENGFYRGPFQVYEAGAYHPFTGTELDSGQEETMAGAALLRPQLAGLTIDLKVAYVSCYGEEAVLVEDCKGSFVSSHQKIQVELPSLPMANQSELTVF